MWSPCKGDIQAQTSATGEVNCAVVCGGLSSRAEGKASAKALWWEWAGRFGEQKGGSVAGADWAGRKVIGGEVREAVGSVALQTLVFLWLFLWDMSLLKENVMISSLKYWDLIHILLNSPIQSIQFSGFSLLRVVHSIIPKHSHPTKKTSSTC